MITIEERAKEYAERICETIPHEDFNHIREDFANGARSEHALLTEWHDPNEPPNNDREVLLKIQTEDSIFYIVGFYDKTGWNSPVPYAVEYPEYIIGWREIHE